MRKFVLPVLMLVLGLFVFAACGSDSPQDVADDNPLIGTWTWPLMPEWRYVFNADGTGNRGVPGILLEQFDWWTVGNDHLRLNLTGGYEAALEEVLAAGYDYLELEESWTFTISGNNLTIESRQIPGAVLTYTRAN